MNILVLSCLNLDLLDIVQFTNQFAKSGATKNQKNKYYLIDHLSLSDSQIEISNTTVPTTIIHRISINNFITNILDDGFNDKQTAQKLTTDELYQSYITYITNTMSINRKLIENIFYLRPELVEFLKKYVYSIIKFIELLEQNTKLAINSVSDQNIHPQIQIISCDPIFHYLLAELKTYQPSAVAFFYERIANQYNMQFWDVPIGWPLGYPSSVLITKLTKTTFCRFEVPYNQQTLVINTPQILVDLQSDNDMYNLDQLTSSAINSPHKFTGEIIGVLGIDDIITGLTQIFQDQIINRRLRVPRHLILSNVPAIKIIIRPATNPQVLPIRVLADLKQQLDKDLITRHQTLLARTLNELEPELENLALEWELRILKHIKLSIQIVLAD